MLIPWLACSSGSATSSAPTWCSSFLGPDDVCQRGDRHLLASHFYPDGCADEVRVAVGPVLGGAASSGSCREVVERGEYFVAFPYPVAFVGVDSAKCSGSRNLPVCGSDQLARRRRHDGPFHFIDEGLHVASKHRSGSAQKELKSKVRKLRSKLDRADARAERLKSRAAQLEKSSTELEVQVKKLKKRNKRMKEASRPAEQRKPAVPKEPAMVTDVPTAVRAPTTVDPSPTVASQPDASWTVVQLRAEARSRGLTGLSGKSKAQLLSALG